MQIFIPKYKIWKDRGWRLENEDVSLTETEIRRPEFQLEELINGWLNQIKVPYHPWISASSYIKQGNELTYTQSG